ncbi:MAG: hypothetical protein HN712_19745 [Gemmatimonadetes bacterium]|nr:hypothetical protein [Gemmatimonadota bacterium]MBT6146275.1 hypothetical protein [Gemmatimonadota bacterium]MBT7862557.1 hypothetical protein [Gemmatimonadota bacterium]
MPDPTIRARCRGSQRSVAPSHNATGFGIWQIPHSFRRLFLGGAMIAVATACGGSGPLHDRPAGPSAVPVGELTRSVWLPAGFGDEIQLGTRDRQLLLELGINQMQWLQRAEDDAGSAEAQALAFASEHGLSLPLYYEPPGFSPYDKLHNWAGRNETEDSFDADVTTRVEALVARWGGQSGFGGYLIGHEDYRVASYDALARTVRVLRDVDSLRPAVVVGRLNNYARKREFLEALFADGGEPNHFQHEHYVFGGDVPTAWGSELRDRVKALAHSYDGVARDLRDRPGRWHAVVQVHGEDRDGVVFYRNPTAAEIRLQAGLALSRGASGIVYFLYSSGEEVIYHSDGSVRQRRDYHGLVDLAREPSGRYDAVRELNAKLEAVSGVLAPLYFRGGYVAEHAPVDEPIGCEAADVDLAFFGDLSRSTHVLVVNRNTSVAREIELQLRPGTSWIDATDGELLAWETDRTTVTVEAGGLLLLARRP